MAIIDRNDLYRALAKKLNIQKKEAEKIYAALFEVITEELDKEDESVFHFPHIGRMKTAIRKPYMANNPLKQEKQFVPEKRVVKFDFFKSFSDSIAASKTDSKD